VLVLDNRRFHKAKDLSVPDNIRLVFLPPYSPELNPGERLWHDLKDHLRVPPARDTLGDVNAAASSLQKAGPARWS
jgi:transposase